MENLHLYEPPLIDDSENNVQLPSIEYFMPEFLAELKQSLTEGHTLQGGEMLIMFGLVLKATNRVRKNGWRWKR